MEYQMTNATEAIIIDDVLKEIGDRLFWDPVRPMKSRRTSTGLERKHLPKKSTKPRADYISQTIKNTVRKVPEVMVKISGGGKSFQHVKNHIDYISRNGGVTLEDQHGNIFSGLPEVRDLQNEWRYGGYPISDEVGSKAAFNIVLSMPPGTDRQAVTDAARDFAKAEFGDNYSYVFARHDDQQHPHVHLCVKARGHDGTRLNPRKNSLKKWRELFAEKLIDHGIEANATRRPVRGVTKRPKKQPVIHMEKRGLRSFHREALKMAAEGFIRDGIAISNPIISTKLKTTRQFVVTSWIAIGHALQGQRQEKLQAEVKAFVKALPSTDSLGEQLEKQLRSQLDKQKHKDKGSER
jgi:hypothetical protein